MTDVLLATSSQLPELDVTEQPLLAALRAAGLTAEPAVWDDESVDWGGARMCLLRSTWDYHLRLPAFRDWAKRVSAATRLWNPWPVLAWNTRKTYLKDLADRGIETIPTVWLEAGQTVELDSLLAEGGWREAVIKPVVGAGANGARRVRGGEDGQAALEALLDTQGVMLQPYLAAVEGQGERALIVIDGEVTHAIRKSPVLSGASGVTRVTASSEELDFAMRTIAAAPGPLLYARVDMVQDDRGDLRLMELEVTEPGLYFDLAPDAAERMARAIATRLQELQA